MKREALRTCWLFQTLRTEELQEIVLHSVERRVTRDTHIFHRGDPGTSLMAVLAGQVDMKVSDPEGNKEISYGRMGPGDFFGEIAVLDGKPRTADAIAVEDTTLIIVERGVFMPILLRHEGLVERLLEVLCARLRSTSVALEEATLYGAEARLARLLCRMGDEHGRKGTDGTVLVESRLTDAEWGMLLGGIARETANRQFMRLEAQGVLSRDGHSVTLTRVDVLREIARGDRGPGMPERSDMMPGGGLARRPGRKASAKRRGQ